MNAKIGAAKSPRARSAPPQSSPHGATAKCGKIEQQGIPSPDSAAAPSGLHTGGVGL